MGRLRHAVGLEHRRTERRFERVHHRGRQRRAARADEAQALGAHGLPRPVARLARARQQELMQCGHRRVPGDAVVAGHAPVRERAEFRRHDHGPAAPERGQRRGHETVDVEQRHHAHGHIIVRERIAASDVLRRDGKVRVLQRNALRTPRAAARVQHQGDVVYRRRRCRCAASHTAQAGGAGCIDVDPENWNAVACGSTRVVCSFRRENQDLRGRVFQIETELVFLVRGVQGSCRSGDRRGQK